MRPQKRSFVVEVKSSRRRVTKPAKSIWGETDLKAIASEVDLPPPRAVTSETTKLVDQPLEQTSTDLKDDAAVSTKPDEAAVSSTTEFPVYERDDHSQASLEEVENQTKPGASSIIEKAATSTKPSRKLKPKGTSAGVSRSTTRAASSGEAKEAGDTPSIKAPKRTSQLLVAATIDRDDLAELVNENARLRRQLADKLSRENVLMKALLARY